ncbi:hypothetical protein HAX54_043139 [Datura stramonium]|uniref:Secreted protein n=1 Tax=Datura stramonium TaxID=4076 RepID=A0ABS8SP22_DATST|nr:hypothetical protein [Datura stramonium]
MLRKMIQLLKPLTYMFIISKVLIIPRVAAKHFLRMETPKKRLAYLQCLVIRLSRPKYPLQVYHRRFEKNQRHNKCAKNFSSFKKGITSLSRQKHIIDGFRRSRHKL